MDFKLKNFVSDKVFVIAEIGKNQIQTEFEQSIETYLINAKNLVKLAKESGADAVKFQTHNYFDEQMDINVVSPHFKGSDRYSWVKRNTEITPLETFWKPLKNYCDELGILFFSTPMSVGAAKILMELDIPLWKVGSGDILDFPLLNYLISTKKPILFSTGMSTLDEVEIVVDFLSNSGSELGMFHCVSKYPCPVDELRLNTIPFFMKKFPNLVIGFSDHSIGYDSAIAAVCMGAKMIEKHFSISRELWGSDHKVSMSPFEFKYMVDIIREVETSDEKKSNWLSENNVFEAMSDENKIMSDDESKFRDYFRKSLVAAVDIPRGTEITYDLVYSMRPQKFIGGIPSEQIVEILGKKTNCDIKKYDKFGINMFD